MTGPTHIAIAAVATVILSQQTGQLPPGLVGWITVLGGALLPDIDEPHSTVSNPAGLFTKIMPRWVQNMLNSPFQAISEAIRAVFGHRGATHYLIWPLVMIWLAGSSGADWLWWLAWGYLWHQLADWITTMGIPAWGPFQKQTFSILPKGLRIKTGGAVEQLINTVCWLYLLYVAYIYF